MNPYKLRDILMAAIIGAVVLAGCSAKKTQSETPEASSQTTPETAAPSGEGGEAGEAGTPAETVSEIWSQIEAEQGKLTAVIQNGQLKDVHHLAFGIRDLVVALADKANAAAPAGAAKLKTMVEQVKASATKLDELGDSGNLSGTQYENGKLNAILEAIKSATIAK